MHFVPPTLRELKISSFLTNFPTPKDLNANRALFPLTDIQVKRQINPNSNPRVTDVLIYTVLFIIKYNIQIIYF